MSRPARRSAVQARVWRRQLNAWMLDLTTEYVGAFRDEGASGARHQGVKSDYLPELTAAGLLVLVSRRMRRDRMHGPVLHPDLQARLAGLLRRYPAPAQDRILAQVTEWADAVPPGLTASAIRKDWRAYHAEHRLPFLRRRL